jgi:hypothetical protein
MVTVLQWSEHNGRQDVQEVISLSARAQRCPQQQKPRRESPRARSEEAKGLEDRLGTMACGRAAAGVGVRSSGVDSRASLAFLTAFGSGPVVSKGFANPYVVA